MLARCIACVYYSLHGCSLRVAECICLTCCLSTLCPLPQNTEFTIKLKQLEDELLFKLSNAEGDITEDVALIESLEESKRVATEINEKVKEAKETEVAINENRNKYRNVAARGAMLFFLLNSLNKIHAFYQFSLNAFVMVFSRGLDLAPGGRRKKNKNMTLRQLSRRISNTQAKDFAEVIKEARRASSASGGAPHNASQTGEAPAPRASGSGSQQGDAGPQRRASDAASVNHQEEVRHSYACIHC